MFCRLSRRSWRELRWATADVPGLGRHDSCGRAIRDSRIARPDRANTDRWDARIPPAFVSEKNGAIRESRIRLFPSLVMSFQTRRRIVRRKRRSSASSVKSLSERLCEWRERNDLSQSEAAIKLRVSKRTLQEWEQGRAEPRHLAMDAIAAVVGR